MTKYKSVPVEPTREMIDAGQPAEMAKEVAIERTGITKTIIGLVPCTEYHYQTHHPLQSKLFSITE